MIENGVAENEIAYIHDANTDEKKEKLFEKVRTGEIRVLIGSTEKMGTGTNIQNKLYALHHLDDANTDEKKEKLFEKVRTGEIRVLIGSTEKMGTGTNIQNKLYALHHLDVPWVRLEVA